MKAEIINQPISGEFPERVYEFNNVSNGVHWTWIKFTSTNGVSTVGQFPGFPKCVKISNVFESIIILTSNAIYRINYLTFNIIESRDTNGIVDVEVSPSGFFIFHNNEDLFVMSDHLENLTLIKSIFKMEHIEFKSWLQNDLIFECEEFLNWSRSETIALNTDNWELKIL